MKRTATLMALFAILLGAVLMTAPATPVMAAHHGDEAPSQSPAETVSLTVMHRINGLDLGISSARLPVDVCVNGDYAFTFEFWDTIETEIPAGNYEFEVFLMAADKCAGTPVLTVGPALLAADSNVMVRAEVSRGGAPELNLWSMVD